MALANEKNVSLAVDTDLLIRRGKEYGKIAEKIRKLSSEFDNCICQLKESGWTTDAGEAFQKMADSNWKKNMDLYADLLDTLQDILNQSAREYENLIDSYIAKTKL